MMEYLPADASRSVDVAGLIREPALGAHLETPRIGYNHHGVYVGDGKVVHYAGFCGRWQAGPIEEITLSAFSVGRAVRIVDHPTGAYSPQEIVDRARSRIGERNYRLLTNNCEHFCNWCISGHSRSAQAERRMALLQALARAPRGGTRPLATAIAGTLSQA